jgi:heterodisulfide reductase subunit A
MKTADQNNTGDRVLVIGGGVGGIRTALDLAEAHTYVTLVDSANSIGGLMTLLDRTFPTNNCDLCTISPTLSESSRSRYIDLMPLTRITRLDGKAGDFTATLVTSPRYIDLGRCTACGECHRRYPETVHFRPGLDHRAPTCMRYPQATPQAYYVDLKGCDNPSAALSALSSCCPAQAIVPDDRETEARVSVASVVLSPGAGIFDPKTLDCFSYGVDPDVLTSLEYERILSASGPTQGKLACPSDGRTPDRIAWIQCVGSRGMQKGAAPYCSSVCCMFALKEAVVTKERFQDTIETTVFYMDMRTFGKDYERYFERSRTDYGVRFVRSRPHSVFRKPGDSRLTVTFASEDQSVMNQESFDLVVLSTGFQVSPGVREMAASIGVELNPHGFASTPAFAPAQTSRPGVYVCGMFESPKDIPETMIHASSAACRASSHITRTLTPETDAEIVPERDVTGEEPRIGVFVCDCGENIGSVIDVPQLASFAGTLPGVMVARGVGHGCSREAMNAMESEIREKELNRVVIGGCSPRTHETRFQDMIRRCGLNRYLLEMANLRDQDAWVHADRPESANAKARQLVWAAVKSVKKARPLLDNHLSINKDVLVVGGGITGMTAAIRLADQGFKVYLVERRSMLGGTANLIRTTLEGDDVGEFVAGLKEQTLNHPNIQVIFQGFIVDHTGMPGMFQTGMQVGPQMFYRQIKHGVTILATGALPNRPDAYLLGRHSAVMTQLDADGLLTDSPQAAAGWETVVMIQCVGSREPGNPNCSRVCCQAAVKNALHIRKINPDARIFILYRDMRTYGFQEETYRMAREKGVVFVRYEPGAPPQVEPEGKRVQVTFTDPVLGRPLTVVTDALLLSTGFASDEETTEDLAAIFKLARTGDGYFLEDHIKLRPVDLSRPGFYLAGTAHSPRLIRESIAQAEAAAARAQTLLSRDSINLGAAVARVDSKKCAACLICVRACPYGVPVINADGFSEIDPAKCHGCGICASECPAKAIQLMRFEDDQILLKLSGLLERRVA